MKEIYFCVDAFSYLKTKKKVGSWQDTEATDYSYTQMMIDLNFSPIVTTSLAHFSFDLISLGYDIYLCYKDKRVKIDPHMDLTGIGEPCKDLRFGHNIFKMFKAGVFNELLGIKSKKD